MKIELITPRGFCRGVQNALDLLDKALAQGLQPYVLNEIVHNKTIIAAYQQKGVIFVKDLQSVPPHSYIVFSAHGVSPGTRSQAAARKLKILDATCPLVKKVHQEAVAYTRQGTHIIYIGHQKHEEAAGVCGEAPQNITLIEKASDIALIPRGQKQYAVLTQTTLNVKETARLIAELKKIWPHLREPDKKDICHATTVRQEAVQKAAAQVEAIIIIGSQNSSNSARLQETAAAAGCRAYLVDNYRELPPEIKQYQRIGLTSGASAPEYLVQECLEFLQT
ncbi:MAG: 4-hydroxy-3-methylbut-2-enyl diphosphate reductase [Candidatus Margulisbacteria bacterium]|jgi:4-hydroxy-3-methylbut-2-enyl diphosphate reductase|nr:4-hydroxy-3-methylbut-2-enyl diphosphate reductase [Candidatus Margulisiibacteriota bacterium]